MAARPAPTPSPTRASEVGALPAWAHPGPGYQDRGGFGSFGRPAPAHARLARPRLFGGLTLIVTSRKALKWRAALRGLGAAWGLDPDPVLGDIRRRDLDPDQPLRAGRDALTLVTVAAPSSVPEQPVGAAQGLRGAQGRAGAPEVRDAARQALARGREAVVVSIESYFDFEPVDVAHMPSSWPRDRYLDERGRAAVDRATILVRVASTETTIVRTTEGVGFPFAYAQASLRSAATITAGKMMASGDAEHGLAALGVQHDEWHGALVPGLSRSALLQAALRGR